MRIEAGSRVGPYEVVSLLGAGGMAEVYRARDTRLGREVALKVLPAAARADAERLKRFELEARATSALNHPNVVAVYDVGAQDEVPYVVTELLEGETLRERLSAGPLPVRKALDYARQIVQGLAAAHDRGIVHRDLKPDNVVVTRDGHVKILDFGLARLLADEAGLGPEEAATVGRVLGTVGYMSPEQVRGEAADARSDIFSFGAVLYEMLSGRRAFRGATAVETMNGILKEDPPPLDPLPTGFPPALERIVWHCLEKDPGHRFQSARDLAFDLDTLTGASLPRLAPLAAGMRRRSLAFGLGTFALGAAAAGLAVALWPARPAEVPTYERLTFRRGTIESARFAPDGTTVVYGAAWAGAPVEVYESRLGIPESRTLGFAGAEVLAVSAKGEMALSLRRRRVGTFVGMGTLARAPLGGGAPREIQDDVQQADWAPDGDDLAVVRSVAGRSRLEYPVGKVLYETAGWVSHPRFSPAGDRIAFLDHPVWGDDGGNLAVVDRAGAVTVLSRGWLTVQGLAWRPDGREVWFTGTRTGAARALNAVTLSGRERIVLRVAGVLNLQDVAPDGRVLLVTNAERREVMARTPGAAAETDLSWFDYPFPADLSDDGSVLYFGESGEGGGAEYSPHVRRTDGAPAVRLGEGAAMALSPDTKWALASHHFSSDAPQLVLLPTGAGQPRPLPRGGVNAQAASFFPDGRRLLLTGGEPGKPARAYVQDLDGGAPKPVTPEGMRFNLSSRPVSPDGRSALLLDADTRPVIVPLDGGPGHPVPGLAAGDQPLRWSADGRSVFAYRPGELPARVVRVELASGRREGWLELAPPDRAGVLAVTPVLLTADGKGYVYGYRRVLSDLYAVTGLR